MYLVTYPRYVVGFEMNSKSDPCFVFDYQVHCVQCAISCHIGSYPTYRIIPSRDVMIFNYEGKKDLLTSCTLTIVHNTSVRCASIIDNSQGH